MANVKVWRWVRAIGRILGVLNEEGVARIKETEEINAAIEAAAKERDRLK